MNYNQSGKLAKALKNAFDCKIVAVVHYSNWGFAVYDNLPRLRSILNEEHPDSFGKNLKKSFEEERELYSTADRVVCLSNYMHQILCNDYRLDPDKISVIPNGLTDVSGTMVDRRSLRKKWNIPVREKIILYAGRMDAIKGLEYLLKAFREILQTYPKSRLVIAGDGAYSKYTGEARDICTRITYAGLLDRQELYEWYRLADIGVTPSLYEPFGYVAVEMMMHELPIVVTATSGLNEVIDDACGLKVPLTEHPERVEIETSLLAQKILYLLQHPAEARQMGRNGRKRFLRHYSRDVFRRNMLNLYESLS
jgi:glycosyltransferase